MAIPFLERNDDPRVRPEKKDFNKIAEGVSEQMEILNNYLRNLHLKVISENLNIEISLSSLCCMRLSLLNYSSKNACLCKKLQNFASKLKTITSVGGKLSINPGTVVKLFIKKISSLAKELSK